MHSMQLEREKTLCAGLDVLVSNAGIGGEGNTVREDNIASAKKVTTVQEHKCQRHTVSHFRPLCFSPGLRRELLRRLCPLHRRHPTPGEDQGQHCVHVIGAGCEHENDNTVSY